MCNILHLLNSKSMIQEEIKCPSCGGNRYKEIKPNIFKCAYCGLVFRVKDDIEIEKENLDKEDKEEEERRFFAELGNSINRSNILGWDAGGNPRKLSTSDSGCARFILLAIVVLVVCLIFIKSCD